MHLFRKAVGSEFRGVDNPTYDLEEIAKSLKVSCKKARARLRKRGLTQFNDPIACKCIRKLLIQMKLNAVPILSTNRQMPYMADLPHVCASTNERSDVVIYSHDKSTVITVIEVNSSLMIHTERKATLVAKDLLRLLRYADPSLSTLSVFCFPKCKVLHCIVEIKVEWKYFCIFTTLKRFPNLKKGLGRLKAVIEAQKDHPKIIKPSNKAVMILSDDDLKMFGTGFTQIDSPSHIIVTDKKNVVKLLYVTGSGKRAHFAHKINL